MPSESRFDDLDLREEAASTKAGDADTTYTYITIQCGHTGCCNTDSCCN